MNRRHMRLIRSCMLPHRHPHDHLPGRITDHETPVTHQICQCGNGLVLSGCLCRLSKNRFGRIPKIEVVDLAIRHADGKKLCPACKRERRHPT